MKAEQWDFTEGDRERAATSLVFRKGDKEFLIAYVICDARNELARAEDIARARLIASAPDLLAALKCCLTEAGARAMTDESRNSAHYARRRLEAINSIAAAAIANAEGEPVHA